MKNCLKLVSALMLISSIFLGCKGEIQYVDRIVEVEKNYAASVIFEATGAESVVNVTMASTTEGAKIYYTIDGTEPSAESTLYNGTVAISEDTTFKAIAVKEGMENSPVSYAKFSVVNKIETKVETKIEYRDGVEKTYASYVEFTATDKEYGVSLTLSTQTAGAVIHYTTDGSTPSVNSPIYVQPLTLEANTTVKAIAIKEGIENSPVSVAAVTIKKITQTSGGAGDPLQIALTADVPHENGYKGSKSNTKVTVTANITTAANVKKVVYKKNGSLVAKKLLADSDAFAATVDPNDNSKWTFDITATDESENGSVYTVAAIDDTGREETEQITIDQFDFTPPELISGMKTIFVSSLNKVALSYKTPGTEDFDHVEISYTYNNGQTESSESTPQDAAKGQTNTTFDATFDVESEAKTYTFYIRSVDKIGNKSDAVKKSVAVASGVSVVYQFHDSVEYLPEGTNGTAGTNATYVYFGDWPQTIKAQNIEIDETDSMTMGDFTYYKGSDDNWYVKCDVRVYASDYTYSDGSTIESYTTKYFKVEPIKWRVLNPTATGTEKKTLLAENILTEESYYFYNDSSPYRSLNGTKIDPNNYKYSNIRAYLNGINNQFITDNGGSNNDYRDIDWSNKGFLYSAFTASAISLIAESKVDNSVNSTYPDGDAGNNNMYACDDTNDKIFLLSLQQITSSALGFANDNSNETGNARIRLTTDFAKANYAFQDANAGYGGIWWLRSPYRNSYDLAHYVKHDGKVDSHTYRRVSGNSFGVVPALCLKE